MILILCRSCHVAKRQTEFYARRNGRRFNECIQCCRAKQNARYEAKPPRSRPTYGQKPIVLAMLQRWCLRA